MTRILLTLLVILSFSMLANAQFKKGSLLVGGELSFSSYKTNNSQINQNQHSGYFNASLGKALSENSVFGINLTYAPFSSNNYYPYGSPGSYHSNAYVIGIFYRIYKTLGKDFYLFGQAGAGYTFSNTTLTDSLGVKQLTNSSNGGQLNFMPGIAYKISKKLFIEIAIPNIFIVEFSSTRSNSPNNAGYNTTSDDFSVSTSLNSNPLSALGIGFRLNL